MSIPLTCFPSQTTETRVSSDGKYIPQVLDFPFPASFHISSARIPTYLYKFGLTCFFLRRSSATSSWGLFLAAILIEFGFSYGYP